MKNGSDNGSSSSIGDNCLLCGNLINKDDPDNWKEVRGWVGGPKKDSMRLRKDTGYFAHHDCVQKLQDGQAVDQPDMFEEQEDDGTSSGAELPELFAE